MKPVKREDVPELEPYIQSWEERMGFVLNDVLILAHKPKMAKAVGELSRAVFDPEVRISLELRNMVAFMASQAHGCQYCMA
ncbi:MAG: carboxymuconolactone decarboxylase family protein, partial [Acidobacteriota bacterium]